MKFVQILIVSSRGMLVKTANIQATHVKFNVLMNNFFSKSKRILYSKLIERNRREFRNQKFSDFIARSSNGGKY